MAGSNIHKACLFALLVLLIAGCDRKEPTPTPTIAPLRSGPGIFATIPPPR
jgi:hypothetical protein